MAIDIANIEANLSAANPDFLCSILQGDWVQYGRLGQANLDYKFSQQVEKFGSQFENHPLSQRVQFWYQRLSSTDQPPITALPSRGDAARTKLVRVYLSATTRQEYSCLVQVPEEFDVTIEGDDLAFRLYRQVDGSDFVEDPEFWERRATYTEAVDPTEIQTDNYPQYQLIKAQLLLMNYP